MHVLYRLSFCKRCNSVPLIFSPDILNFALQAVTGDRQNRQHARALDELLSAEGGDLKKFVLVVDRIDVLGKHADSQKGDEAGPLYLVSEHLGNSGLLGSQL